MILVKRSGSGYQATFDTMREAEEYIRQVVEEDGETATVSVAPEVDWDSEIARNRSESHCD